MVHDESLPGLLARMSDSNTELKGEVTEVAPSVAEIMVRTRNQISARRKGKARDEDVTMDDLGGTVASMNAERRGQLMAKLEEERKKFIRPVTEGDGKAEDLRAEPPAVPVADTDRHEKRLRTQARLQVKLAFEKRLAAESPETLTYVRTPISPSNMVQTPISSSLDVRLDSLKTRLLKQKEVADKEMTLKERLRKRKQSFTVT